MNDPNNIYIARDGVLIIDSMRYPNVNSMWANPYKSKIHSNCIELYEKYIRSKLKNTITLVDELFKLKNKNLYCWCVPQTLCYSLRSMKEESIISHGQILSKLIIEYEKNIRIIQNFLKKIFLKN